MKIEAHYFEKLYDQADLVLIPSFKKKKEKHLLYTYIDPIVRIPPEKLPSESALMKALHLKRKPFVVMLGGSDFGTKLAKHIISLSSAYLKEDFIIFGGNLDLSFPKNVSYIRYTPDFLKYLKVSKGVITLAGQKTLSEALVYKKPILCFPIEDHIEQVLNAYALRESILVSHEHSLKAIQKSFSQFLAELPALEKKVKALDISSRGSQEFVRLLQLTLKQ